MFLLYLCIGHESRASLKLVMGNGASFIKVIDEYYELFLLRVGQMMISLEWHTFD